MLEGNIIKQTLASELKCENILPSEQGALDSTIEAIKSLFISLFSVSVCVVDVGRSRIRVADVKQALAEEQITAKESENCLCDNLNAQISKHLLSPQNALHVVEYLLDTTSEQIDRFIAQINQLLDPDDAFYNIALNFAKKLLNLRCRELSFFRALVSSYAERGAQSNSPVSEEELKQFFAVLGSDFSPREMQIPRLKDQYLSEDDLNQIKITDAQLEMYKNGDDIGFSGKATNPEQYLIKEHLLFGTEAEQQNVWYELFRDLAHENAFQEAYVCTNLFQLLEACFFVLARANSVIIRCRHCEKYVTRRTNATPRNYCSSICQENHRHIEVQQYRDSELNRELEAVRNVLYQRKHHAKNKEIEKQVREQIAEFKIASSCFKNEFIAGRKTPDEFYEFISESRRRYNIKPKKQKPK